MGNWPPSRSIVVGTLLGGAVGDAMGAPFEGLWSDDIPSPEPLLSSFHEYHGYPSGQYTDDTQLTIATIRSIVENGDVVIPDIARSIAELWRHHSVIGPGGACTQAAERYLATGDHHDMGAPVGQAGNGTAMRTAALGLWFGADRDSLVSAVADVSRLTHQDPRSVAGGVAIALAANLLASEPTIDAADLCDALASAISDINAELSDLIRALPNRMRSPDCRQFIAAAGQPSAEFSGTDHLAVRDSDGGSLRSTASSGTGTRGSMRSRLPCGSAAMSTRSVPLWERWRERSTAIRRFLQICDLACRTRNRFRHWRSGTTS